MATITIVAPQTAAAANQTLLTENYDAIVLHADALAGVEEVLVFIAGGAQRVAYPGPGSAQARLSATTLAITLPAGPCYLIDKPATAGACGVYASVAQR